jgi:hypothetical protein
LFIPDPDPDFLPIPDPRVKKAPDPGSGSTTLIGSPPDQKLQSRGLLSPAGLNMAKLQEGVKMFYVLWLLANFKCYFCISILDLVEF